MSRCCNPNVTICHCCRLIFATNQNHLIDEHLCSKVHKRNMLLYLLGELQKTAAEVQRLKTLLEELQCEEDEAPQERQTVSNVNNQSKGDCCDCCCKCDQHQQIEKEEPEMGAVLNQRTRTPPKIRNVCCCNQTSYGLSCLWCPLLQSSIQLSFQHRPFYYCAYPTA